jgi:hypothetical protein
MISTAVSFPSVMIPRFNQPVGERNHFRMLLLADFGNGVIRPFCITILYHNLLVFIDIFHI